MTEELNRIEAAYTASIGAAASLAQLEALHLELFGRGGRLSLALRQLGQLPVARRPALGRQCNQVKQTLLQALKRRRVELSGPALQVRLQAEALDVTMPGTSPSPGRLHPLREFESDLADWLSGLGFSPDRFEPLPAGLSGLSGRRYTSRLARERGWGGGGHQEGLSESVQDPACFHLLEAVALESGWRLPDLKGLLEAWGRQFLGYVSLRLVPAAYVWAGPAVHLLGPYRGGWLALASGALLEALPTSRPGMALAINLERLAAVRYNLPPVLFQSLDWRFLSQF